jgi:hypothetical protein
MPHFQNQHDAPPGPMRLHDDHVMALEMIRASLTKLHKKIDDLVARFDVPAPAEDVALEPDAPKKRAHRRERDRD